MAVLKAGTTAGGYVVITTNDYTASDILTKLKTVDGSTSGLDADLLDSHDSSYFATSDHNHTGVYQPAGSYQPLTTIKTATITTTWTGASPPYTQVVSVSGIIATDYVVISPVYSSTLSTALAQKAAWLLVDDADTGSGNITFTCFGNKPVTEIPIQIKVV